MRPQYSNGNGAFPPNVHAQQQQQPNIQPYAFGTAPVPIPGPVLLPQHQPSLPNNVLGNIPDLYTPFPYMQQTNINVNGFVNHPPPNMTLNPLHFPSASNVSHFPQNPVGNHMNHQNRPPPPPRVDPRLERHRVPPLPTQPLEKSITNSTLPQQIPTDRPNGVTNRPTNNQQRVVYKIAPINRRRISIADYKMKGQSGGNRHPDESSAIHSNQTNQTNQTNQSHKEAEKETTGEINSSETIEIVDSPVSAEIEAVFSPAESETNSTPNSSTPEPVCETIINDIAPTEHESSKDAENELNGIENDQTVEANEESDQYNYESEDSVASDATDPFIFEDVKKDKQRHQPENVSSENIVEGKYSTFMMLSIK